MPWTVEEVGKSALETKIELDWSFLQLLKRFTFEYPRVNAIADASCIDEPVRALYNCIVRKYVLSLSKVAVQFDAKESEMNVIVNIRVLQNQTLQWSLRIYLLWAVTLKESFEGGTIPVTALVNSWSSWFW